MISEFSKKVATTDNIFLMAGIILEMNQVWLTIYSNAMFEFSL